MRERNKIFSIILVEFGLNHVKKVGKNFKVQV